MAPVYVDRSATSIILVANRLGALGGSFTQNSPHPSISEFASVFHILILRRCTFILGATLGSHTDA